MSLNGVTGDVVSYECLPGYTSSSNVATCRADRTWDFSLCEPLPCTPKTISNSDAVQVEGNVGDVLLVSCDDGYFGGGHIACLASTLEFTDVTCSASSCDYIRIPGSELYSTYDRTLNGTTGTTIDVVCQSVRIFQSTFILSFLQ